MAFAPDIVPESRRASQTSFEAWLPQFSGLHRPKGIEILTTFDEFVFKSPIKYSDSPGKNKNGIKSILNFTNRIEVFGNQRFPVLVGVRRRSLLRPFTPPISIFDLNCKKILTIDSFQRLKCFWNETELQILSTSGQLGVIRFTTSHGVKTYEILDSYGQLMFYITPNLAPHQGLQLLILGAERSILTGAIFERQSDFSLETFKPISPESKALLVSFTFFIIFSNARTQFDIY